MEILCTVLVLPELFFRPERRSVAYRTVFPHPAPAAYDGAAVYRGSAFNLRPLAQYSSAQLGVFPHAGVFHKYRTLQAASPAYPGPAAYHRVIRYYSLANLRPAAYIAGAKQLRALGYYCTVFYPRSVFLFCSSSKRAPSVQHITLRGLILSYIAYIAPIPVRNIAIHRHFLLQERRKQILAEVVFFAFRYTLYDLGFQYVYTGVCQVAEHL